MPTRRKKSRKGSDDIETMQKTQRDSPQEYYHSILADASVVTLAALGVDGDACLSATVALRETLHETLFSTAHYTSIAMVPYYYSFSPPSRSDKATLLSHDAHIFLAGAYSVFSVIHIYTIEYYHQAVTADTIILRKFRFKYSVCSKEILLYSIVFLIIASARHDGSRYCGGGGSTEMSRFSIKSMASSIR